MTDKLHTLIAEECAGLRKRVAELEEECRQSMVEIGNLRSDIERHVAIGAEQANEIERLKAIIASFNSSPSN